MTESKPAAPVVCISRQLGAQGEEVGRMVATELGFAYVDEELISRAAQKAGVPADLVADVEGRKPYLHRLLEDVLSDVATASMLTGVAAPPANRASDDYRRLIQEAIHEAAGRQKVVIVAHAASIALAGRQGVLRVLVAASPEVRAGRLERERGVSRQEAERIVRASDRARAEYLKDFYDVKQELPTHYDLVVSTDVISPETAAGAVLAAAGR